MTALEFLKWYFDNQVKIDAAGGNNAKPSPIITQLKENTWSMNHQDRWLVHELFKNN